MDLTTFDHPEQAGQEFLAIDVASLYQAFEQVKDGRGKKGKRYPLALILTLIMLGKMAGETTIEGIIDWINGRTKELSLLQMQVSDIKGGVHLCIYLVDIIR